MFLQGSVVAFLALSALFFFVIQSSTMSYTCILFALLMCGFIFALKKTTDVEPLINISIFSFFAFFIVSSIMTGGSLGAFGSTVLAIPIIAFFLVGLRAAKFWFAVCLLLYFAERTLALFGGSLPNALSLGMENISKSVVYLIVLCGPFFILDFYTRKRFAPHYATDEGQHQANSSWFQAKPQQPKLGELENIIGKLQAMQAERDAALAKLGPLQTEFDAMQGKLVETDVKRQTMAEAVQSYEQLVRNLMTSSRDSFHLYDAALNWIDINEAALELLGKKKEDLVGKNLLDLAPSLKDSGRYEQYKNVMATGKPVFFEDVIPTGKGRLHFKTCVLKFQDGIAIITEDVSEMKKIKAA